MPTVGEQMLALKERSGLSLAQIADLASYRGASSVHKLFKPEYARPTLPAGVAHRLAKALAGRGDPPIEAHEILVLAHKADTAAPTDTGNGEYTQSNPAQGLRGGGIGSGISIVETPIFMGEFGGTRTFHNPSGGEISVDVTRSDHGNILGTIKLPARMHAGKPIVVYMGENSMYPRVSLGEPILADRSKPPTLGDLVMVVLEEPGSDEDTSLACVLIRVLAQRNAEFVELAQYNPEITFRVPAEAVRSIRRVAPWYEALGLL